jgi:hypothetical protein
MKKYKQFKKAFGVDDYGFPMIPKKYSNVKISRIKNTDKVGGCPYCFPHGIDCTNSTYLNQFNKNWKRYRKTQYKTSHKEKSRFIPNPYRRKDGQNTFDEWVNNGFEFN